MTDAERPLQTPCEWCGNAITQPPRGRLLRYCDQSHRQRAYEVRAAERRLQADLTSGRVREVPAERIVERVVHRRHPTTLTGWTAALEELAAQLSDGRLPMYSAGALHRGIAAITAVMPPASAYGASPLGLVPVQRRPAAGAVDEHLVVAIVRRLRTGGGTVSTSLLRIAGDVDEPVDVVRQAVLVLTDMAVTVARRHGVPVDVDGLSEHARFDLVLVDAAHTHGALNHGAS